jgi:signal transduction histidine kinase
MNEKPTPRRVDATTEMPREELLRILLAVRAVARASGPLDFERILSAVLDQILHVLQADRAAVYLLDSTRTQLVWAGGTPTLPSTWGKVANLALEGSLSGEVVRDRCPRAFAATDLGPSREALDAMGIAFMAIVPLYVQDRPCGVVHVGRRATPFVERELDVAVTLGELLVVYLENARLYADAQARLEETAMILDVARSVTASLELRERLAASADGLARLVEASNAFVLLVEEGTGELVITESDPHWEDQARGVRLSGSVSAAATAIREKRAVLVEDAQASPIVSRDLVERFHVQSVLAIPLFVGNTAIGAAVAIETRQRREWTPPQVQRGEVIAHQIAIAVAHARLYDELKRSYDELARTQEELVQRERLAALGQLAATLAHEVRNPLGVLFNSISTLDKMLPSGEDTRTLLRIMTEESLRLERLVRELLDFARPPTATFNRESLHAIVDEAVEAAARELGPGGAHLTNEVADTLPPVCVDAPMLRRALLNLLVNGAQATGGRGTVIVRATATTDGGRSVVCIEVADDGPGIRADAAPRIFEPFFTTKATGTGLGLAIVKEIVEAHSGEIRVHSGEGRGTTLVIVLPQRAPELSPR